MSERNPLQNPEAGDEFTFYEGSRPYILRVVSVGPWVGASNSYVNYLTDYFKAGVLEWGRCNKEWWDVWVDEAHAHYVGPYEQYVHYTYTTKGKLDAEA